jgi:hypothetical protein
MINRIALLLFLCLFVTNLAAQNFCRSDRFTNPVFFSEDKIISETQKWYGSAIDWRGTQDTQRFYIAYPDLKTDELKKRPFIMLMHGGGLAPEDDFSNKNQYVPLCKLLAKRGFVAATIDYRVGWDDKHKPWYEYTPEEKKNPSGIYAIYRAYQDARAALRYFVHNASEFEIDTNNIFVGGRSAGGDLSIASAFYTQRDVDSILRTVVPDNCHKMFGALDSSTNTFGNKYKIRGIANMWGPIYDTAMISKTEALAMPMIMFHGTDDKLVTYKNWTTLDYPFIIYGSYYIAQRYRNLGACYQLNTKMGGGHGEDFSDVFLAEHMAAFFKSVMCNNCNSREFSSEVSVEWKIKLFFESGAWINLIPLVFITLVFIIVFNYLKRRRNKNKSL